MALPSTLHHFDLQLSHVDRGLDRVLALKAARHPSETLERLWLRVLALAWQYEDGIGFGPGLCEPDAPDVLATLPDGAASLVVRVGRPDPERVGRDVAQNGRARVAVLFESPRRMEAFLSEAPERSLDRLARVELAAVEPALLAALAEVGERRVRCELTLVADHLYLTIGGRSLDGPLHRASAATAERR
jgi:uncharacterized protein YaeQ